MQQDQEQTGFARADPWIDVGVADELSRKPLQEVLVTTAKVALGYRDGRFAAISGGCNHVGGPRARVGGNRKGSELDTHAELAPQIPRAADPGNGRPSVAAGNPQA